MTPTCPYASRQHLRYLSYCSVFPSWQVRRLQRHIGMNTLTHGFRISVGIYLSDYQSLLKVLEQNNKLKMAI